MKLSKDQETRIEEFVDKQGIRLLSLRDDILDHLCCAVQNQLKTGKEFDQSLQEAVFELAPNGLIDLEKKTMVLLNSKRIMMTKKLMYCIGFVGALALTTGVIFKVLSYPGANMLLMTGALTLLFVFLPMITFYRYKVAIVQTRPERLRTILGFISGGIVGISMVFKLMHWMGADILLLAGGCVFALGYLPFLFFTMYKKSII